MVLSFLIDIIILLLAAVLLVPLSQWLKLGAVPGFIIAGIISGPAVFGVVSNVEEISHLSEIGVILLLFIIGVELRPTRLWLMRRLVFGLGSLQVLVTGTVLSIISYWLFNVSLQEAILIGPALALSSTAFVLQLLLERRSLTTIYGRAAIAILLLQDLAVIPLITLVPLLATPDFHVGADIGFALLEACLILALVIFGGRYFLHPILHRIAATGNPDVFTAFSILLVIGTALITEHAGLSMGLGAFLAGLLISDSSYRHQMKAEIQPFRGLLLGLFFMSMGMSINLDLLYANPFTLLGIVLLLVGVKVIILVPIAYFFGIRKNHQIAVSLLLAQGGEFALVLFALAHELHLMSHSLFQYLLLIILLSMLSTPLLAGIAGRLTESGRRHARPLEPEEPKEPLDDSPIVIAGFGRVGHRVGEMISLSGKRYIAVDSDPAVVQQESQKGVPIFYGDVRNPGVLRFVGGGSASVIIVTVNEVRVALELVSALREQDDSVAIYARGHNLAQCIKLKEAGATNVVSENIEASLGLADFAFIKTNVAEKKRETIIDDFRQNYHSHIDEAASHPK